MAEPGRALNERGAADVTGVALCATGGGRPGSRLSPRQVTSRAWHRAARDYPLDFLEIAQVLEEAGRSDDALVWAEKGLTAFEDTDHHTRHDLRLDDFVLGSLLDRDRVDDALGDRKQTLSYRDAVQWIEHIRTLYARPGDPDGSEPPRI